MNTLLSTLVILLSATLVISIVSKSVRCPLGIAVLLCAAVLGQIDFVKAGIDALVPSRLIAEGIWLFALPTLVFEATLQLDSRQLRRHLSAVLLLAVTGVLLTMFFIASLLYPLNTLTLPTVLLLGAILATVECNVLTRWFKRYGVRKRFDFLIRGESLFTNVMTIVLAEVLFMAFLANASTVESLYWVVSTWLWHVIIGVIIGWLMSSAIGWLLNRIGHTPFISISLNFILVYGTFLLAETLLHASGIVAIFTAGIIAIRWEQAKISPRVIESLRLLWRYLTQMIRLGVYIWVGLHINVSLMLEHIIIIVMAIIGLFVSRIFTIYSITALVPCLPHQEPIEAPYRTIMIWGGMRGSFALALVAAGGSFPQTQVLLNIVVAVVLVSEIVQGLTVGRVMRWLNLDQLSLADRLAQLEGTLEAQRRALSRIPEFQRGGLFSARIAEQQRQHCEKMIRATRTQLLLLREQVLNPEEEQRLLFIRMFAVEKKFYQEMFIKGHLSERAYRNLNHSIDLQSEAIRHEGQLPKFTLHFQGSEILRKWIFHWLARTHIGKYLIEYMQTIQTAHDYEEAWGRHQGNNHVLACLDDIATVESTRPQVVEKVRSHYRQWHNSARERIDHTTEHFSAFVTAMQEKLAERLILHAEREAILEQAQANFLPPGVAEHMLVETDTRIHRLKNRIVLPAALEPTELLKRVPFFQTLSMEDSKRLSERLKLRLFSPGESIVNQGELGDALFIIIHGVVRVSCLDKGQASDIATLMAGDFFGEETLKHSLCHTATYRAVTFVSLYELTYCAFEELNITLQTN